MPATHEPVRPDGAPSLPPPLQVFLMAARVEDCGVPEEIIFVEALPRGRTGKVDRRALREQVVKLTML